MLCHKLADPLSSLSKHLLLHRLLPFIIELFFEIRQGLFVLFFILSLNLSDFFSVLVHFVDSRVGIIWILRFLQHSQEDQLFLSESVCHFSGHKSSDCFLNHNHLFIFEVLGIIRVEILLLLSLFLLRQFFNLSLLIIGCFEGSHDTLPSSFYFLDDSNSSLHVGIQGWPLFDDLLFRKICLF